jgi:pantoate--beta-alanine ligase
VVKTLVRDLSFPVKIETIATLRESTGLAMSSRNVRLTEQHRKSACEIYNSLLIVRDKVKSNEDFKLHIDIEVNRLTSEFGFDVEYFNLVKAANLETVENLVYGDYALCFAGRLGGVRLIDNVTFTL